MNCFTYAFSKWWKEGGYVRVRRSLLAEMKGVGRFHIYNMLPHFLHESKDGVLTQYKPMKYEDDYIKKSSFWRVMWKYFWHDGYIAHGDETYLRSNTD